MGSSRARNRMKIVVALAASLCRHLRLDRLQLRVMVLLWLPCPHRLRFRLLDRPLSHQAGKVRPAVKVISLAILGDPGKPAHQRPGPRRVGPPWWGKPVGLQRWTALVVRISSRAT